MTLTKLDHARASISLSRDELLAINNALNEVCNGLDAWEFSTRMGVSQQEAAELLAKMGALLSQMEDAPATGAGDR